MSKKILAVALAAAMILGLASVAFAASFSDTEGHEREAAIKQLAGLGLLDGYPDGTFRPENPITRAEFAKVMVYALGLKDAAEMLAGVPVPFTDVEPNHWAVGYISIAASQEIVKGYPDGTFGPQNNVTYAEVITMILRALGYGPVLDKQPWPMAYLTKATELKINKGVNFVSNAPATRGDVAALIANALTTPKLVPVEYGADGQPTRYAESGSKEELPLKTLLHNLGAEFITGWLEDSPELWSNKGGIVIEEPRDKDGALLVQAPATSKKYELAEGTEVAGLLGHKVRAWVNEDGEVFFLEDITPASAVKSASYSASTKVKVDGKEVSIADATIFRNYVVANSVKSGDTITVIYSGNTRKYVVAVGYDWGVVGSVNLTYSRVSFKAKSGEVGALILDDNYEVVWDGAANSLDDVEENDVFDFIYDSTNKKAIIIVTRDSVIGKFTKLTGSAATIDGVDYSYK
ncbi:MAG: S-layer homology domain-containing protein, partial [Firmicutes bacterium]|nr:S-layer homology domain-containing protein [Candidatus Fermentithermobacillaceae bacterium]